MVKKYLINGMHFYMTYMFLQGFPGGPDAKNLPAMQETQVGSLGWEESPGEGNDNPSSILA